MTQLRCRPERLWDSLMEMAKIGATAQGGCNRQALTDEDRRGRELFRQWVEEAGCQVRVDQMGNVFARRSGGDSQLPPILVGSHLDTQPTGGRFDGVYGVLAGLELVRALNDDQRATRHPIDVVVWTNEEGARFAPAMVGSGVWSGALDLASAHDASDPAGLRLGDELARIGYLGSEPARPFAVHAAFEAHIEQGPVLEDAGLQIGVVTGVQGMRWYDLVLRGQPSHAGTTPMPSRRDPAQSFARIASSFLEALPGFGSEARCTFANLSSIPNSRNTVPAEARSSVDLRHPEPDRLEAMEGALRERLESVCADHGTEGLLETVWGAAPIRFADACVNAVRSSAAALGLKHHDMVSGAGHDSVYVSQVAPTSMIFVPCRDGLSHNEAESATREDLAAGCDVLLGAVLERDGDPSSN